MAGALRPSIVKGEEARYTHLGGSTSSGQYSKKGAELFNGLVSYGNSTSEGSFYNYITKDGEHVLVQIDDYCNIYGHMTLNTHTNKEPVINYVSKSTGKLIILQHDGTDYTIDVTDKYWVGRHFNYQNATVPSNGLTFEEFLDTELIDRKWQKIVANLPPGKYKFMYNKAGNTGGRSDDEWFLEKVKQYSHRIKDAVLSTIQNNELFKNITTAEIEEE